MKNRRKILIGFLVSTTLIFLLNLECFASYSLHSWYSTSDGHNYGDTLENNSDFLITHIAPELRSLKFTQDNTYYIFDVVVDYKTSTSLTSTNKIYRLDSPLFVSQYNNPNLSYDFTVSGSTGRSGSRDTGTDYAHSYGNVVIGSNKSSWQLDYEWHEYWSTAYGTWVSQTYPTYKPYAAGLPSNYSTIINNLAQHRSASVPNVSICNSSGVSVSSSAVSMSTSVFWIRCTGKIKITKSQLSNYRYLSMCIDNALYDPASYYSNSPSSTNGASLIKCKDVSGNSIDLLPYAICGSSYDIDRDPKEIIGDGIHDWHIICAANKDTHNVKCSKCEWLNSEPHNFEYEYDGLTDNLCVCGTNKNVNYIFEIYDDIKGLVNSVLECFTPYTKVEDEGKTGYIFKWYEKYEKHFASPSNPTFSKTNTDIVEKLIATPSIMTDSTDNFSTRYKAVYEPCKYIFHFSNTNNLSATFSDVIPDRTYYYDQVGDLPTAHHIDNYICKGWSLTAGGIDVELNNRQDVFNYTTINNAEFTFYPVYVRQSLNVSYRTYEADYGNKSSIKDVHYNDTSEIKEFPHMSLPRRIGFDHYTSSIKDKTGIYPTFKTAAEFKTFVIDNEITYIILNGTTHYTPDTSPEHTDSDGPSGPSKPSKPTNVFPLDKPNIEEIINPYVLPQIKKEVVKDKEFENEIFGFTLSDKFFKKWGLKIDKNKNYGKTSHRYVFTAALPFAKYLDIIKKHPILSFFIFAIAYVIILLCEKKCYGLIFGKDKEKD